MSIRVEQNIFLRTLENASNKNIWFIHGFAESSFSFVDLFGTSLRDHFNLYAPDFPGFGVTPHRAQGSSIDEASQVLLDLIEQVSPEGRIYLVGHSLGAIICTHVAQQLTARVAAFVSIEGNLTEADAYFQGKRQNTKRGPRSSRTSWIRSLRWPQAMRHCNGTMPVSVWHNRKR